MQAMNWDRLGEIFPFPANIFPQASIAKMLLENLIFNTAARYSADYTGGQWHVQDNLLVAPEGTYNVVNGDNYYEGKMDNVTFGAALTSLIYNRLLATCYERFGDDMDESLIDGFYTIADRAEANNVDMTAYYRFLD